MVRETQMKKGQSLASCKLPVKYPASVQRFILIRNKCKEDYCVVIVRWSSFFLFLYFTVPIYEIHILSISFPALVLLETNVMSNLVGVLDHLVRALRQYRRGQSSIPGQFDFFQTFFFQFIRHVFNCDDLLCTYFFILWFQYMKFIYSSFQTGEYWMGEGLVRCTRQNNCICIAGIMKPWKP